MLQKNYFFGLLIVLIIAFCNQSKLVASNTNVQYKEIITSSRFFDGKIGESSTIQLYLQFENYSQENSDIYSVSGYYTYEKYHLPIAVVGLYDGTLTLYVFNEKGRGDSLVNFVYDLNHFETITHCQTLTGYKEKFVFDGNSGTWTDGKKVLPFNLYETDLSVYQKHEYLIISGSDQQWQLDLRDINATDKNFELVSSCNDNQQVNILLKFSYPSNNYVNGRCGAGIESGYLFLQFDEPSLWVTNNRYLLESCYEDIYTDSFTESPSNVYTALISTGTGEQRTFIINKNNCQIAIK